ncbi:MAG: transposase, partial [Burkholderiales bacterium]
MIDLRHPRAVLASRLAWSAIDAAVAPELARERKAPKHKRGADWLSDEELVERWAENVQWQFFGGRDYYAPRLPCDATQIGRF